MMTTYHHRVMSPCRLPASLVSGDYINLVFSARVPWSGPGLCVRMSDDTMQPNNKMDSRAASKISQCAEKYNQLQTILSEPLTYNGVHLVCPV